MLPMPLTARPIVRFDFLPGRTVAGKYVIERKLGSGYEGEVYAIVEKNTGVRRAAKFYYPHRDPMGKSAIAYARKLDALRHCQILLQYHHQETATVQKNKVAVVVSELFEGEQLSEFLKKQPNGLSTFEALHVLYTLVRGIAPIHARGEYHGDIHDDNVMIRRQGIGFEVRLVDFFDLGRPNKAKIRKDVLNLVMVFHTIVGGRDKYADQPPEVKYIIRGLKDSLILARFQSAGDIQRHLEALTWSHPVVHATSNGRA
ncbi:MAG: serine/threonine protein kinase [Phycisphaerales bacterium]|nr:serine/threonine protein kinase [Phycisphaerales bacterium]